MASVYWVTGLSGAGKTTISQLLYERLRSQNQNVIYLDGDILRDIFGNDLGYSLEDRKKSAMRNSRLCKALSDQGFNVICSTISMFHECREWNRMNIQQYVEIYIRVPWEVLMERDQKQLYSRAARGEIKNVVGFDLPFEEPLYPDIILDNDGHVPPQQLVDIILNMKVGF